MYINGKKLRSYYLVRAYIFIENENQAQSEMVKMSMTSA